MPRSHQQVAQQAAAEEAAAEEEAADGGMNIESTHLDMDTAGLTLIVGILTDRDATVIREVTKKSLQSMKAGTRSHATVKEDLLKSKAKLMTKKMVAAKMQKTKREGIGEVTTRKIIKRMKGAAATKNLEHMARTTKRTTKKTTKRMTKRTAEMAGTIMDAVAIQAGSQGRGQDAGKGGTDPGLIKRKASTIALGHCLRSPMLLARPPTLPRWDPAAARACGQKCHLHAPLVLQGHRLLRWPSLLQCPRTPLVLRRVRQQCR